MIVNVRLFAGARELCMRDTLTLITSSPVTLAGLRELMNEAAPALKEATGRWAVNLEFVPSTDYIVQPGDEVAWVPPVSGG